MIPISVGARSGKWKTCGWDREGKRWEGIGGGLGSGKMKNTFMTL